MDKRLFSMKRARTCFWILIYCIVPIFNLIRIPEAQAHPHIFIIQCLNVVFDEKGLAGIKVRWKFDDMFASMIAEDHDINRNGKLETSEVQEVKKKAFSFISEHSYFTFIKIDNVPFQVKFIKDFNAILENRKLVPKNDNYANEPKNLWFDHYFVAESTNLT